MAKKTVKPNPKLPAKKSARAAKPPRKPPQAPPALPEDNGKGDVASICKALQALQRQRRWYIGSRCMLHNRLRATVAATIGYFSGLEQKERAKLFIEAETLIKKVYKGEVEGHPQETMIKTTWASIATFLELQDRIEKLMLAKVVQLPVSAWADEEEQRGFGQLSLAILVGECGNLADYANPAKVWRRMCLAPYEKDGVTLMGSTWKRNKKLHAEDWEKFGYSPRRRSIAYVFGENLVKQNKGKYRARYDAVKAKFAEAHPDDKPLHAHLHAMLLATKLLVKSLWCEWNHQDYEKYEREERWKEGREARMASKILQSEGSVSA